MKKYLKVILVIVFLLIVGFITLYKLYLTPTKPPVGDFPDRGNVASTEQITKSVDPKMNIVLNTNSSDDKFIVEYKGSNKVDKDFELNRHNYGGSYVK